MGIHLRIIAFFQGKIIIARQPAKVQAGGLHDTRRQDRQVRVGRRGHYIGRDYLVIFQIKRLHLTKGIHQTQLIKFEDACADRIEVIARLRRCAVAPSNRGPTALVNG